MLSFMKNDQKFILLDDNGETLVTSSRVAVLFSMVPGAGSVLLKIGDLDLTRAHHKRFVAAYHTSGLTKEAQSLCLLLLPINIEADTVNRLLDTTGYLDVYLKSMKVTIPGWNCSKLDYHYVWEKNDKVAAIYLEIDLTSCVSTGISNE